MASVDLCKAGWADSHDSQPLGRISRLVGLSGFFPCPGKGHGDEANPVNIEEISQFLSGMTKSLVLEQSQQRVSFEVSLNAVYFLNRVWGSSRSSTLAECYFYCLAVGFSAG